MTVLIGSWEFEGPFEKHEDLRCEPGIYVILTQTGEDHELIEIDESESVGDALKDRTRLKLFGQAATQNLSAAVYYCSDLTRALRQGLIEELFKEFELPEPAIDFQVPVTT